MPSEPALVWRVRPVSTFLAVTSLSASALPCRVAPDSCAQVTPGAPAAKASAEATNDAMRLLLPPCNCFFIGSPRRNRSRRRYDALLERIGCRSDAGGGRAPQDARTTSSAGTVSVVVGAA